ncbi:polyprenol phosphomannose-dependent alpha 1,6 mannosyltransferase MptB [Saccharothrix sp. S26]|uniref:polyprenol phosphomannose-dependent alpha 1,6 mannosyltransferase MptB n=1 Tax=Saccharothrix sp. S26 TaxID=2907215 RepID=UPI001F3D8188|nr:polyprenol phosphomannose-dependent alpha 1,6 mannosyltransferase MptB [Saccharothrix sp. S26]MCE6995189.1 polyprenol phosphomannose-dependent alpha 1,6 mannosyltransferase MptB [Saccharothrix sp. S26]
MTAEVSGSGARTDGPARKAGPWATVLRQVPPNVLRLGALGGLLITVGGIGAGAVLRRDPLLSGTILNAVRYGHGRDLATAVVFAGVALLVYSWVRLGRMVRAGEVGGRGVVLAAAAWTAPMIIAPALYSRDVYSYLAQGAVLLRGYDPYTTGASALPLPLGGNVASLWQDTPSPYGPLFLLLAKSTVAITGDNVIIGAVLMRLAVLGGLVLLAWAMPGLARHLGGRTSTALWLTVANPFVIAVGIGGAHNDILMVGLMAVGVLMVLDRKHVRGIAVIALATAVKATAVLVVPFLVWVWVARLSGPARQRFFQACAVGGITFAGVFALSTIVAGVDLGWINVLQSQTPLLTWMSLPCAAAELLYHSIGRHVPGATYEGFLGFFRAAGVYVLAIVLLRQWWLARAGGVDAVRRAAIALLAASALAPSVLPWYFTWALALAAAFAWQDRWLAVAAGFSVWMVLVTLPDGTIVARWHYGSANPVIWWSYLLVTVLIGVWVGRALLGRRPLWALAKDLKARLNDVEPPTLVVEQAPPDAGPASPETGDDDVADEQDASGKQRGSTGG